MGQSDTTTPSEQKPSDAFHSDTIAVNQRRHVFFLPLRLDNRKADGDDAIAIQQEIARCLGGGWRKLHEPFAAHRMDPHDKREFDRFSYAEFVYFHDFIQSSLSSRDSKAPSVTFLERPDIHSLTFTINKKAVTVRVERLWLCFFEIGVAVAMLEVHGDACTLSDLLRFQNAARRVYPPYFTFDTKPTDESLGLAEYPEAVELHYWDGRPSAPFVTDAKAFFDHVRTERCSPLASHWAQLLAPLSIVGALGAANPDARGCIWRQTIDERLPTMTFAHVADAGRIGYPDWVRLGSMDDPGKTMPYGAHFLAEYFDPAVFYDRHWHKVGESSGYGTRYLISGFGFVVVTDNHWFANNLLSHHFSRMYATMGLLIHAQHAALLSISAEASLIEGGTSPDVTEKMHAVQRRFNRFVQKFWFTGVSNQLQARELYERWSAALGLPALYAEVSEQIKDTVAMLDAAEQGRQSDTAMRLNMLAAGALPATIATGLAGMNVVITDKLLPGLADAGPKAHIAIVALCFALTYGITAFLMSMHNTQLAKKHLTRAFSPGVINFAFGVAGIAAVILCVMLVTDKCVGNLSSCMRPSSPTQTPMSLKRP